MSAPLGYNANASMLPSMSGTIHPMSGGSQSPYPEGTSAYSSLLPASPGPIVPFRGGVQNANAAAIAVAASAAAALSDPPAAPLPAAPLPADAPAAASLPVAPLSAPMPSAVASNEAAAAIAVAASLPAAASLPVAPLPSLPAPLSAPMPSTVASNEAAAAIAVAASAASSASAASIIHDPVQPIVPPASKEAAIAIVASEAKAKEAEARNTVQVSRDTNPFAIAAVAAVSIKNKLDKSRDNEMNEIDETKEIIVYGKKYHVTNPYDEGWTALLEMLHFNVFDDATTQTIKEMIYDQPKCVEDNLPISSLIRCIPMRKIIQMIAYELLLSGKMDESSYSIHINFDDEKQAKAISTTKMELPIASPTAVTPEAIAPEAPGALEAPPEETRGGARKARKRRVIRQHA